MDNDERDKQDASGIFDFSKYDDHDLIQIREAFETLQYYGFSDIVKIIDAELGRRRDRKM